MWYEYFLDRILDDLTTLHDWSLVYKIIFGGN